MSTPAKLATTFRDTALAALPSASAYIERRWVVYGGVAEATTVPPSWFGWLHHTVDVLPTKDEPKIYPGEKPHRPNLTGTPGAYRPSGSTLAQGRRPKATGDYKAWTPGNQ